MDFFWISIVGLILIFIGLPILAFLVGKYLQVGKLSGTKSFVKHCKGEESARNNTTR